MLTLLCLVGLVTQISASCLQPSAKTSKAFPDAKSYLAGSSFYLTAEVNVQTSDTKETAYFEEISDTILKTGVVNYLHENWEQVVYYSVPTNEAFEISSNSASCKTYDLTKLKDIFPNKNLKQWYSISKDNTFLGPYSVLENAFRSFKKNKNIVFLGPSNPIRGIPSECWAGCSEDLLFTYCFADSSLPNPYGFNTSSIPLRVTVTDSSKPDFKLTYEYFDFDPVVKVDFLAFPLELGCQRLGEVDDSEDIPSFGDSDLRIRAEVVYDDLEDQFPNFVTDIELVYKKRMNIASFTFTKWKTAGKKTLEETPEKTIYNLNTGSTYTIDRMTGACSFAKNDFQPRLQLPDNSHLAFDNPELLVNGFGFYKADVVSDDRGFETVVYEKQVDDYFMGKDYRYPKASVTRYYLEDDTFSVLAPTTENLPSKVVLKLKSADGIDRRIIVINFFTFTKKVNDLSNFDIDSCFTDESEYSWIQFRFKTPQETKDEIIKRSVLVPDTLKGALYRHSEATPLRFSKFLVDYDCDGMTVSGKLYEHDVLHGFTPVYNKRVKIVDGTKQTFKNFCAFLCQLRKECSGFSECSDTCIMTEQKPVQTEVNGQCITYIKNDKISPNASELVRSFKQILLSATSERLVLPPTAENNKLIELEAIAIETSQNDVIGGKFPDIFALANDTSYEVSVEVNYQENLLQESLYFEEKYDIVQKEGKIVRKQEGKSTTYFYFLETNELFTITDDNKCDVETLNDSRPFSVDFLQNWSDFEPSATLLGPSSVLRNAYLKDRVQSLLYMPNSEGDIRGISNVFWMHCPSTSDNMTVKYYFAKNGNRNPMGFLNGSYPLRVRVYGQNPDSEDLPVVDQTYEFLSFKPFIDPESIAVPHGLGCQRLASSEDLIDIKPFPDTQDYMLGGEIVFDRNSELEKDKLFSYFQVTYDHRSETIAIRYTNWKESREDGPVENPVPYKMIVLRRSGVAFFVDLDTEKCSVLTNELVSRNFKMPDGTELDIIDLVMSTEGYTYLDRYRERDLPVLGFEKVLQKYKVVGAEFDKAIITRFTLEDDTYFIRQERYSDNAPVRVTLKLFKEEALNRTISVNVFGFKTVLSRKYKLFNIDECYQQGKDSAWFQVMYPVDDSDLLKRSMENVQRIKDQFVSDLIYHSQISPYRFADILVETDDASIFVVTKVLERPDPLVDFTKKENKTLILVNQEYPLLTAQECAVQCLESNDGCGGFSYCGGACQLANQQPNGETPQIKDDGDCSFYELTTDQSAPTSKQFLKNVEKLVEQGEPRLVFPPNKVYADAGQISPSVFTTGAASRYGNIFTGNKEYSPVMVRTKYVRSFKGNKLLTLPLAQCLRICSRDPDCTSVSVCMTGDDNCVTSTLDPFNIPEAAMTSGSSCAILGKSYVSRFSKYPGVAHLREPEKSVEAASLEECAMKCFTEKSMDCLSFDTCDGGSTCYLHSRHALDVNSGDSKGLVEKSCVHYSKRYMYDFKLASKGKQAAREADVKVYDSTLEQCARACADGQKGIHCMSFDYCAQNGDLQGLCLLSTEGGGGTLVTKDVCNHFLRTKDLKVTKTHPYSYGLAGGIGFLFIVIGAVLGIAAMYGYGYYKANRQI